MFLLTSTRLQWVHSGGGVCTQPIYVQHNDYTDHSVNKFPNKPSAALSACSGIICCQGENRITWLIDNLVSLTLYTPIS